MKRLAKTHWHLLIPIGIGLVFIAICAIHLTQPVWFDEAYTSYLTRFSFSDIWQLTATDAHPPLYYFLVKIWVEIFGRTDFVFRLFSSLCGAVALLFAYLWLRRSFSGKIASIATALMACCPLLVYYGQEARMYTLAAALIFAATYVLSLALEKKRRRYWLLYGLLVSLGMWTHYFTALVWGAQLLYLLSVYRQKIFRQKSLILGYVFAVLLYLPWVPALLRQARAVQGGFWIGPTTPTTVIEYFSKASLFLPADQVLGWSLLLFLALIVAALYFIPRALRAKPSKSTSASAGQNLQLLTYMAVVPVAALIILSLPPLEPLFLDRYIIYSAICLFGLFTVACLTTRLKHHLNLLPIGCLLLAGALGIYRINTAESTSPYEKRIYGELTSATEQPLPLVVFGGADVYGDLALYYNLAFYQGDQPLVYFYEPSFTYLWNSQDPLRHEDYGKITDLAAFTEEHPDFWAVSVYGNQLPAATESSGLTVLEQKTFDQRFGTFLLSAAGV